MGKETREIKPKTRERREVKHTKSICKIEVIDLTCDNEQLSVLKEQIPSHEIENAINCPITLDVMKEPVIIQDGHTYEKTAILQHFQRHGYTSPITRQPVKKNFMILNRVVKNLIQQLKRRKT